MARDWVPWNGRMGQSQSAVAVVIHWYCDNQHQLQVLGSSDIDLESGEVHIALLSPWAQSISHEGTRAYNLECDLCPRSAIISERTARAFLEPLRSLYLEGKCELVNRINITATGSLPKRV